MSALNRIRHIVILLLIGFVGFVSFSNEISLFACHPPLMLIGVSITIKPLTCECRCWCML